MKRARCDCSVRAFVYDVRVHHRARQVVLNVQRVRQPVRSYFRQPLQQ